MLGFVLHAEASLFPLLFLPSFQSPNYQTLPFSVLALATRDLEFPKSHKKISFVTVSHGLFASPHVLLGFSVSSQCLPKDARRPPFEAPRIVRGPNPGCPEFNSKDDRARCESVPAGLPWFSMFATIRSIHIQFQPQRLHVVSRAPCS